MSNKDAEKTARDDIRSAFFSIVQRKKIVRIAGMDIELRQPAVQDILETPPDNTATKHAIIRMLCDYCFVPGTDIKVFDPEDAAAIMAMPFGSEWQALNGAINELTDLDKSLASARGNFNATPEGGLS